MDKAFDKFFTLLDGYGDKVNQGKTDVMKRALEQLLACSPKKVVGNFQEFSLEIRLAYVWHYNKLIDTLAEKFPRCRAGIFASRLNYSDVLHISEEVLPKMTNHQVSGCHSRRLGCENIPQVQRQMIIAIAITTVVTIDPSLSLSIGATRDALRCYGWCEGSNISNLLI